MNKLVLICGVLLLMTIIISGVYISQDNHDEDNIESVTIKNPKTGEVWNSVEEFEYRNLNLGDKG